MNYTYNISKIEDSYRFSVDFPDRKSAWAIFAATGELLKESGNNMAFLPFPEDLKAGAREIIQSLPNNQYSGKDVFIRFGDIPKGGKSTNWATGQSEKGLSAYETIYNLMTGEYRTWGALEGAELAYLIKGANIYFVTGEVVGKGADGEPLLVNAEVLGQAAYNKSTGAYRIKEEA